MLGYASAPKQWRWSSVWRREHGDAECRAALCEWPIGHAAGLAPACEPGRESTRVGGVASLREPKSTFWERGVGGPMTKLSTWTRPSDPAAVRARNPQTMVPDTFSAPFLLRKLPWCLAAARRFTRLQRPRISCASPSTACFSAGCHWRSCSRSYCLQASWAPGTKKPSFTSCVILGQLGQQPMTYSCPFQPASLTLTVGGETYSNVTFPNGAPWCRSRSRLGTR